MKNRYLIIFSIFVFACESNVESAPEKLIESKTVIKEQKNTQNSETAIIQQEEQTVSSSKDIAETQPVFRTKQDELKTVIVDEKKNEETVGEIKETAEKIYPTVDDIQPNYTVWNTIAHKNISATGVVNYKAMKTDNPKISAFLKQLSNTPPKSDWSKNEKLAYWLNLYNASTVYLIATNYPVSSITKINGGKPWDKKFVKSGDKIYSLNDIENKIVRPTFKDPRVHAALNCAAKSCPKILNGAFLPSKLNAQLNSQVRAWINDVSKNKLTGSKAQVSQIFDWYKADFSAQGGVIAFINKYISTNVALAPDAQITYLKYNWALNE